MISFVVLITYGILMKQSTSYALTVMLLLAGIIILIAGFPVDEGVKMLSKGIGSQASTLVLLLNFTVMMDLVNAGEGFTALGSLLSGLAQSGGATASLWFPPWWADLELRPPLYWKFRSWLRCSVRWQLRQDFLWVFFCCLYPRGNPPDQFCLSHQQFYRSDDHRPLRQHEGKLFVQTGLVPLLHGLSFYFMLSSVQ